MVLTCSMTTKNNQEGEPHTTALERQVQTLVAAMECLSKQNRDLGGQLCRRNAGPNNQGEEQEDISPQHNTERRDREGSEGSNALSRQERQDTDRPSVTGTAPPHMIAEMQIMKERMDFMMNTLKGRVSNNLNKLVH